MIRCKVPEPVELKKLIVRYSTCLVGRHLLFIGDSNLRTIGRSLIKHLGLTLHIGTLDSNIPQDTFACSREKNMSISQFPHHLPYYVYQFIDNRKFTPVAKRLDDIPAGNNSIVIIHMWLHLLRIDVNPFRDQVRTIRHSIERLLNRAPHVDVFIKGPHAFTFRDQRLPADDMARRHEQIWFEEFQGLHHKVVYLDNWDMTVGNENGNAHPNATVVEDMVRNLLAHICDIE